MSTPGVSFGTTNMLKPRLRRASWLVRVKTRRNARCRNGSTEGMRFQEPADVFGEDGFLVGAADPRLCVYMTVDGAAVSTSPALSREDAPAARPAPGNPALTTAHGARGRAGGGPTRCGRDSRGRGTAA
jgi:hypothetical protein